MVLIQNGSILFFIAFLLSKFSILINGEAKGSIVPSRGLRQGDPLSPYLFLLITEGLSSLLREASSSGFLNGIDCSPTGPRISHLLFADNSLLICKADERNCSTIKRILGLYKEASSESINYSKSAMIFSPNVNQEQEAFLSSIMGVKMQFDLGTYLGLP